MKCPRCGNPLIETIRQRIAVDHCPVCGGIWLDRGRIDELLESQADAGAKGLHRRSAERAPVPERPESRLHRGLAALASESGP